MSGDGERLVAEVLSAIAELERALIEKWSEVWTPGSPTSAVYEVMFLPSRHAPASGIVRDVEISTYVDATDAGAAWSIDLMCKNPEWTIDRQLTIYPDDGPEGGIVHTQFPEITLANSRELVEQLPMLAKELLDLPIPPMPDSTH